MGGGEKWSRERGRRGRGVRREQRKSPTLYFVVGRTMIGRGCRREGSYGDERRGRCGEDRFTKRVGNRKLT